MVITPMIAQSTRIALHVLNRIVLCQDFKDIVGKNLYFEFLFLDRNDKKVFECKKRKTKFDSFQHSFIYPK